MIYRIGRAALLLSVFCAAAYSQAPTVINSTDLLVNSRTTINTNFSNLYANSSGLVDCSGTANSWVVTLHGGGTAPVCRTMTWASISTLTGYPGSLVYSFNSRSGAVSLEQSDVSAVEQDLRNTASPTFSSLGLGANLSVTGTSTLTGNTTVGGTLGITGNATIGGTLAVTGGITSGAWSGTLISPTYGGTGVNNGSSTLTLAGNMAVAGAYSWTLNVPAAGSWTLPAAGTLVGSADTGTVTNTMLAGSIAATKITGTACVLSGSCTVTGNLEAQGGTVSVTSTGDASLAAFGSALGGTAYVLLSGNNNANCWTQTAGSADLVIGYTNSCGGAYSPTTEVTLSPTSASFAQPIIVEAAAATAAAGQISYGGTTAATTNCGSLASAVACIVINVAGTTHYVPYY
ncbi:MAG: hypothetical protein ACLGXA_08065 [Acidobacteriota bacterium]